MRSNRAILISTIFTFRLIHQGVPIDDVSRQFHVIIRKFSNFGVVHAQDFCLFGGAKTEAGDQIHDEEDDAGAAEGVGEAGDGVGELIGQLHPVAIEPAAFDQCEAVEVGYVVAESKVSKSVLGL